MTFVRKYDEFKIAGRRKYVKEIMILRCDECGLEYKCPDNCKYRIKNRDDNSLSFCSKKCSDNSKKLLKKRQEAVIEKYDGYYVTTTKFLKEQKDVCLSLYGVKSRFEAEPILEKIRKTNIERYGRPTFAGSKQHIESCDWKDIAVKAWKTKIKNGSCSKSLPEEKMYAVLVRFFGDYNVKRQVPLIRQWVDFYIASIKCYVQVDGEYWHGLNRSSEEISLGKTSQDKKIYKQILRDRQLNQYCCDNNINIFRITDVDVKTKSEGEIYADLLSHLPSLPTRV